jgi:LCP family protein required for cell wall assembly
VAVPGQAGRYKIDQAFDMGASVNHSFDDGVRLARQTIEQDYGIPIDRYAWIGLDGFSSVINTLGGLDIDVTHPLLDDNYPDDTGPGTHASNPYAVKRLYRAPGPQHLTGDQALEYVRSRHADLVGDIGRTQRLNDFQPPLSTFSRPHRQSLHGPERERNAFRRHIRARLAR